MLFRSRHAEEVQAGEARQEAHDAARRSLGLAWRGGVSRVLGQRRLELVCPCPLNGRDTVNPLVGGLGGAALVWQLSAQPGPRPIGITSRRGPTSSGG